MSDAASGGDALSAGDAIRHSGDSPAGRYTNSDLAPTRPADRTWTLWSFAALWIAMSVCIPTYMLASGMIRAGMNWWQSLLAVFLGNAIVFVPLAINGQAGARYGIPSPVFARAAFGLNGAQVPALLRTVVACGWFGLQNWIGGQALDLLLRIVWPGWAGLGGGWTFMGHGLSLFVSFLIFWLLNIWFAWAGFESIKRLEALAAPLLLVMSVALVVWAVSAVGGFGTILRQSDTLIATSRPLAPSRFFMTLFLPWVTATVGFWATLSLNIPDFTRFAKRHSHQAVGQAIGLLTAMPLFAFVGIVVTSATLILYGQAIWNPIDLVSRIVDQTDSPWIGITAMFFVIVATLSTNIAANVVASANGFANLAPQRISFRTGALIAGVIAVLILPWELLAVYETWLISYSGLLGAVVGVLVCDYLVVRRGTLRLGDLYSETGEYWYGNGVNTRALVALAAGIGVALLGLVAPGVGFLFDGAWFSAAIVAFLLYLLLMRGRVRGGLAAHAVEES